MSARTVIDISEGVMEERRRALDESNEALKGKLGWILDWQKSEISRSILGRWDLGEEIDEVWRDLKTNAGRVYGRKAKKTISLFLKEDPSIVNMAHKLYMAYQDRKSLVDITEMTMQDGVTHLSYTHFRNLLAVKDPQRRHQLMNECLEKCWTSAELSVAVQKLNGGTKTNNPRGRTGIPKDAHTVIDQMLSFADDFENRNSKVWKDQRSSLSAQVDRLEPIQYTEELAKKLGELAHRMRQLADEAVTRAEEAERKFEQITRALDLGPEAIKPITELMDKGQTNEVIKQKRGDRPVGRPAKVA